MNILFLTLHDRYQASSQVRAYQFLPFLEKEGLRCRMEAFFPTKKKAELKFVWLIRVFLSLIKRYLLVITAGKYDAVFVQSDVLPFGLSTLLKASNPNIIFEFDDAIWEMWPQHEKRNFMIRSYYNYQIRLFYKMMKISKFIIAENSYLADYARKFNKNVYMVTAPIDTDFFKPVQ